MNEKVSIIIPMYNAEKSVKRCLKSALKQTYKNIEIICINDGSKDSTAEIVASICKTDTRVVLINKENGGVSSARNLGIEKATGYYIQFLDVDDALEQNATERMVEEMSVKNVDIVICGYHNIDKTIEVSLPEKTLGFSEVIEDFIPLYQSTYLNPPWNKMYIRENIVEKFPAEMSLGEDLVFNLCYLRKCEKIRIISDMVYVYTVGQPDSLTSKYNNNAVECLENKIKCVLGFLSYDVKDNMPETLADNFWLDYKHCIDGMISSDHFSDEQLKLKFAELRNTVTWYKCFCKYLPREKESLVFWNKDYNKYITIIKRKSKIQKAKRNVKKILRRIKGN